MTDSPKISLARLDHLRFFAATLVIFHHFKGNFSAPAAGDHLGTFFKHWLDGGATGVTLFLVLSGFLFCMLTDAGRREIEYVGFIKNRIIRIFPLLMLFFFTVLCVNRQSSTPIDLLRLLTLQLNTGNPTTGWGNEFFPTGPIWTIGVEFQFYLLFPLIIVLLHRFGPAPLLGWIAVGIFIKILVIQIHGTGMYYNLYHSIIGRLDQFLIGILFGYLHIHKKIPNRLNNDVSRVLTLVLCLVLLTLFCRSDKLHSIGTSSLSFTIEALLWCGVLYAYITISKPWDKHLGKLLSYLGSLSYSMYLWHLAVGLFVYRALAIPDATTVYVAIRNCALYVFPATLLVSAISFHSIEKPFLSFKSPYLK